MPSRFFDNTTTLLQGTLARAEAVELKFEVVDGGFVAAANEMNRAIRFTDGSPAEADFQLAATPAQRALKILGFNAVGSPEIRSGTFTWRGDWVTATSYTANDVVRAPVAQFNSLYVATASHVAAADIATDIAAGRLSLAIDMTDVYRWVRRYKVITANYAAVAGDDLFVDVSAGALAITLPAAPALLDQPIHIVHAKGNVVANPITVARNGKLIMALAEDMTVDVANASFELAYMDATQGWRLVKGT